MERELLSFVMTGHVDHGKSTLIGRLLYETGSLSPEKMAEVEAASEQTGRTMELAFVMDSLEEERNQGITIDAAQVWFKTEARDYVIIDAPGHREFMRNMITGASQAEAAVIMVDVDEGLREQTRRHAHFVSLLDIDQIIVAANKMDKVDYSEEVYRRIAGQIHELIGSVGRSVTHIVPMSAREGENITTGSGKMPWWDGPTFLEALEGLTAVTRATGQAMRYPVQDVFAHEGGPVLFGRVERGRLAAGQEVVFMPSGRTDRIASIEVFGRSGVDSAEPGQAIGITVGNPEGIERGEIALPADEAIEPRHEIRAKVFWMASEPADTGETLTLRCATQEAPGRIERIERRIDSASLELLERDAATLQENDLGEVLIKTDRPVIMEPFHQSAELGRFVLTRGDDVVAGGIVTVE